MRNTLEKVRLLGLGLDGQDGHKRITNAEEFLVLGGSEGTHEKISETLIKTFEGLKRTGRSLQQIEAEELKEIICKNTPR